MASQGPNLPGTGASGAWTTPGNVTATDAALASLTLGAGATDGTGVLATGFGFTVPVGSTVNGIVVTFRRKMTAGPIGAGLHYITDFHLYLKDGGSTLSSDFADAATDWSTTLGNVSYGSAVNDLGFVANGGTVAHLNAATFGVLCQIQNQDSVGHTGNLDSISVTAFYTIPAGGGSMYQFRKRRA